MVASDGGISDAAEFSLEPCLHGIPPRTRRNARRQIMELLRWKTRISALWIILGVNYITYLNMISRAVPNEAEVRGGGGLRIAFAGVMCLPFLLAWLSLTLKDSANRRTGMVFAIIFAITKLIYMIRNFAPGKPTAVAINELWGLAAALLIIWYACKWPKREA